MIVNDDAIHNYNYDEMQELETFECSITGVQMKKLELDLYLEESCLDRNVELDVLDFFMSYLMRFPDLSSMAHDILTIKISIVALKITFNTV